MKTAIWINDRVSPFQRYFCFVFFLFSFRFVAFRVICHRCFIRLVRLVRRPIGFFRSMQSMRYNYNKNKAKNHCVDAWNWITWKTAFLFFFSPRDCSKRCAHTGATVIIDSTTMLSAFRMGGVETVWFIIFRIPPQTASIDFGNKSLRMKLFFCPEFELRTRPTPCGTPPTSFPPHDWRPHAGCSRSKIQFNDLFDVAFPTDSHPYAQSIYSFGNAKSSKQSLSNWICFIVSSL